jgi:hypothetical protein
MSITNTVLYVYISLSPLPLLHHHLAFAICFSYKQQGKLTQFKPFSVLFLLCAGATNVLLLSVASVASQAKEFKTTQGA